MKKSLLALAVVAVAASANAATVYEKDGTTLGINGRIQSVFYSGNYNTAGVNDSSIQNSSRFGLEGKTQLADWVAGIGYAQWDMDSNNNDGVRAREQYVGADFGEYGQLIAGKFRDSSYYAENVTDHYEDAAGTVQGHFNGARRAGQLMYTYDNYGFHAQAGVQTAQDDAPLFSNKWGQVAALGNFDVDSGFNGALGYTFDNVVFGPLSLRTGYSYIKGQQDEDAVTGRGFDNFKHATVGASWGNLDSGFYVAALYDYAKMTFDKTTDTKLKLKGFELSGGYAFDNGVSFLIGYESAKYESDALLANDIKVKRIPVFVNYKINSNFNVWGEAGFNAGSDHLGDGAAKKIDRQVFSVGARYTF